ncbi:MAG TPA: hypothetical protein VF357_06755 [Candidatus Deferrimicrobium sp.]
MIGFRSRFLLVIAATVGLAAAAWAEGIFPVNNTGVGNWVFDQPSVVASGSTLYLAFVGNDAAGALNIDGTANTSLNTRLYYAAVNGGADFKNKATTRTQVLLTAPVAIDSGDAYTNARHPQIALRSTTELVILFQAIPAGETNYKLFRALVTISGKAVASQSVAEIRDAAGARIPGKLTDPSFALVTSDNTLRIAFSSFPSPLVDNSTFTDVYYARVGWDAARVLNNTILLTTTASTTGVSPIPRLRLDSNRFSHIVWAANNSTGDPTGIYYAMVHAVSPSVVDNLAIGATQVLSGGNRWGFPSVVLTSAQAVWILASDVFQSGGSTGLADSVGITEVNPYAVTRDGNPVSVNNIPGGSNISFFRNPPGGSVLSADFDAYHPEVALDSQNRMHVAGYGFRSNVPPFQGTPGRYYVMSLGSTVSGAGTSSIFASMVASPVAVGTGDLAFAMELPGDYTRPAFVHFSGKSVNLWSGPDNVVTGARNLYVTSTFSPSDPTSQSGCSMVDDPRRDEAGRIPATAVLLLPAAFLALRRATRKAFAR